MGHSRDSINRVVKRIIYAVSHDCYTIELNENRQKNIDFLANYGIKSDQLRSMLQELKVEDYCSAVNNLKTGFEDEILYIFGPRYNLFPAGEETPEEIIVYLKINIIENSIDYVVVVSFHKAEQPMNYAFK